LLMYCAPVSAQYILNEADAEYRLFNYVKAIDLYEQAYQKKNTLHAAEHLAEGYSLIRNYAQAESWYAVVVNMPGSKSDHVLNYAKALVKNSKYAEARVQFDRYFSLNNDVRENQKNLWLRSCDSAIKWMQHPVPYTVQNLKALNSPQSDWGAVKLNGSVIFTSDRGLQQQALKKQGRPFLKFDSGKAPDKNIYGWTGNQYLRLYEQADKDSLSLFPLDAMTDYHVGAASFNQAGTEMYFTLTRIPKKPEYAKERLATINVELYTSKKSADGWGSPFPFKFNKVNAYSIGDPFVGKDGKTLYFVSNMPGGKGGTDIYCCRKDDSGEWQIPVNLTEINTENNERSPFFDQLGNFYFSSDGYAGMGDLDIFSSKSNGSTFSKPVNLGYPLNSPHDDFAYSAYQGNMGYLSSNRVEGLGNDDIYSFTRKIIEALKLEGRVFNQKTRLPIPSALVSLKNKQGNTLRIVTDNTGYYSFEIDKDIPYEVVAEKTGFRSADTSFVTQVSLVKDFYLIPIELNKPIRIENIYYDFDKSNIRPDAAVELDKLVKIMKDNPTIWIELGSHTDSRGNDQYNQWLSQSRANSAVQYIIDRGIEKNRITAKGYGESLLINKCSNGAKCSEADHQLNRRTEFKIVKQ
jgi:peptidoglycan-associated lipoprotein